MMIDQSGLHAKNYELVFFTCIFKLLCHKFFSNQIEVKINQCNGILGNMSKGRYVQCT